ncbi:MAG: ABC transporter ATP-binding protein/permease [Alphaproteobacteria bacterium]
MAPCVGGTGEVDLWPMRFWPSDAPGPERVSYRDFPGSTVPRSPFGFLMMFVRHRFAANVAGLALSAMAAMGLMGLEPVALRHLVEVLEGLDPQRGPDGAWPATLAPWLAALGGLWMASALFNRIYEWVDAHTSPRLRSAVQAYLFSYLMEHAPQYFHDNFAGRLGQKIKQAPESAMTLMSIAVHDMTRIWVILGIALGLLASSHLGFALLLLGWTALFLYTSVLFSRRCVILSRKLSDDMSAVSGRLVDSITNADLVRSFVGLVRERTLLAETLSSERNSSQSLRTFLILMRFMQYNATLLFQIILVGMAVNEAVAGRMRPGDFVMVFSLSNLVATNVWNLSNRLLDWFEHLGTLTEAIELIIRPHAIVDPPGARTLEVGEGAVEIEDLCFVHADGTPVFESLRLAIAGGEKVALVGPSGAGKSTLIRLLLRHYEPQGGSIRIDGQDIAGVTLDSLNHAIAEVPQVPGLFHRPIGENITYARPGASEEDLWSAASRADCHDFIMRRPAGYDTVVGERGVRLSGGERQRVAIARAFLKDAPILILDEATSSLDSETEHMIQQSLWRLMEGRTVIAVAHRLSTITGMDRVFYMEAGRIVEEGSHAALLRRNGPYARLWNRQVGGFLP